MKKKTKKIRRATCCGNCKNFTGGYNGYSCQVQKRDVEYDWVCDYHKKEAKEIK